MIDAGEPAILLGTDTGPNPAEYLLHALAACLTTSLVYVAAARGVAADGGGVDARGRHGRAGRARPLRRATATASSRSASSFRVEGNAPEEKLREVVERAQQRSAVFDMVTNGVPVTVDVATA